MMMLEARKRECFKKSEEKKRLESGQQGFNEVETTNLSISAMFISPTNFGFEVMPMSLLVSFCKMAMIPPTISELPGSLVRHSNVPFRTRKVNFVVEDGKKGKKKNGTWIIVINFKYSLHCVG